MVSPKQHIKPNVCSIGPLARKRYFSANELLQLCYCVYVCTCTYQYGYLTIYVRLFCYKNYFDEIVIKLRIKVLTAPSCLDFHCHFIACYTCIVDFFPVFLSQERIVFHTHNAQQFKFSLVPGWKVPLKYVLYIYTV